MNRLVFNFYYRMTLCLGAMVVSVSALGQSPRVLTEVNPSVTMVGERAEYVIRFINTTQVPNLATPRVEGLAFSEGMSTSSFTQIVNGARSVETRASWSFSATRAGTFTIPGRSTRIGGEEIQIPPVSFEVVPMDEATRSRALLQLDIPDGPFYVGQAIPAKLGLFVRDDLTLSNIAFPERDGEAFLNTEFDNNPARTRTRIQGRIYEAFVWQFTLTPIKAGSAGLQFRQNIAIQESLADGRFPSIFNLSRTQTEQLTVATDPLELDVLPLPREGRPDSFRDAIGQFEVSSTLSSRDLMVGEPITLNIAINGIGNFDRISPPDLPQWDDWRIYPPKVDFKPDGNTANSGTKQFEYILIPQAETITEVPAIEVAWFDPALKAYATALLEARAVTVKPADKPLQSDVFLGSGNGSEPAEPRVPDSLLPIRPEAGWLLPRDPLWRQSAFVFTNGLLGILLLSTALLLHRRKRLRDDHRLARRHLGNRKIRHSLQLARKAASDGNARDFFEAARTAIQERASHLSKSPVEAKSLVSSDCLDILTQCDLPESFIQHCTEILQSADACQFAGYAPADADLSHIADKLVTLMTELNRFQK
jgi:hypothetical protein